MSTPSAPCLAETDFKGTGIHLAVSGTYSTGKSTTTEALSLATGIPRTHAMTSREILVDLVPGKQVQDLNAMELMALGLRRLEERIHNESGGDAFISDGSVIHEWVYGQARLKVGINPGASWALRVVKTVAGLPVKRFYRNYGDAYGVLAKARAQRIYDAYVHLPVEFDMHADGHRPVSEPFRRLSDELLLGTVKELGLPYVIARGSVQERLEQIVDAFQLPLVMDVGEAVAEAMRRVAEATRILEEDDRVHEARRKKGIRQRVRYAMRY